ncbi:unnamed protein product [Cylindrotheca closterium]|uniref:Pseudouridine synthase RsuA/RluA-like domain-containing protein n=1 Tax=Cylindrotheca closterium TaxID=2856 RepID=A0AAD2JMM3_9STRA|nr:unnamed protein product [Cylindrotheca closterium]
MPSQHQIPATLCIAGILIVAPYWITVNLAIQGEKDDTYGKLLARMNQQDGKANRWKNFIKPSIDWWIEEFEAGRVTQNVDGSSTALSGNDLLATTSKVKLQAQYHYHEQSIRYDLKDLSDLILYQDEQYLVVNKPVGVDVLENPAAGRVHNSLPGLLKELFSRHPSTANTKIIPAHRLDGPVSGVVCCGITSKDTRRLQRKIQLGQTSKSYVARVQIPPSGLPQLPLTIETQMGFDNSKSLAYVVEEDTSKKDAKSTNGDNGKYSKTVVQECLRTIKEDNTAIVTIRLFTGRKHQIRCHLQHVGLSIANDHRYGGKQRAPPLSAFDLPNPRKELMDMLRKAWKEGQSKSNCTFCEFEQTLLKEASSQISKNERLGPSVNTGIWLHSWKYAFPTLGMEFEAPLPQWARRSEPPKQDT